MYKKLVEDFTYIEWYRLVESQLFKQIRYLNTKNPIVACANLENLSTTPPP